MLIACRVIVSSRDADVVHTNEAIRNAVENQFYVRSNTISDLLWIDEESSKISIRFCLQKLQFIKYMPKKDLSRVSTSILFMEAFAWFLFSLKFSIYSSWLCEHCCCGQAPRLRFFKLIRKVYSWPGHSVCNLCRLIQNRLSSSVTTDCCLPVLVQVQPLSRDVHISPTVQ